MFAGVTVAWFLVLLFARDLVFGLLGAPSAFVVNTSSWTRWRYCPDRSCCTIVFFMLLFIFAISVASLVLTG